MSKNLPTSAKQKKYDWTPCEGCYINHISVYNTRTGKKFKPVCKSYRCEKHGWMHTKRLEEAIHNYFKDFKMIRMWTFTLTSKCSTHPSNHAKILSKCWRYFMTFFRRSNLIKKDVQKMQYVRVAERHKSGYWHLHVLVDQYVSWDIMNAMWNEAIRSVLKMKGKFGHVNVKGSRNPASAAKYVAKYVTKASKEAEKHMKLWTKSSNVGIFEKSDNTDCYAVYHHKSAKWVGLRDLSPVLIEHLTSHGLLNLSSFRTSSQKTSILTHKQEKLL